MPNANSAFKVIAHRGASLEAPENTLPAIQLAFLKYKVDMAEVDLQVTRDGIPVVIHDETLERTTDGRGLVREKTLKELKELDAGWSFDPSSEEKFPYRGKGVKIPTLEEILTAFPKLPYCLEVKVREEAAVQQIAEVLKKISHPSIVGSFHAGTAKLLRQTLPSSYETLFSEHEAFYLWLTYRLGVKKITPPARYASLPRRKHHLPLDQASWIAWLHRQGVQVFFWTINDPIEMKELIGRGADGLITDDPARLSQDLF